MIDSWRRRSAIIAAAANAAAAAAASSTELFMCASALAVGRASQSSRRCVAWPDPGLAVSLAGREIGGWNIRHEKVCALHTGYHGSCPSASTRRSHNSTRTRTPPRSHVFHCLPSAVPRCAPRRPSWPCPPQALGLSRLGTIAHRIEPKERYHRHMPPARPPTLSRGTASPLSASVGSLTLGTTRMDVSCPEVVLAAAALDVRSARRAQRVSSKPWPSPRRRPGCFAPPASLRTRSRSAPSLPRASSRTTFRGW